MEGDEAEVGGRRAARGLVDVMMEAGPAPGPAPGRGSRAHKRRRACHLPTSGRGPGTLPRPL